MSLQLSLAGCIERSWRSYANGDVIKLWCQFERKCPPGLVEKYPFILDSTIHSVLSPICHELRRLPTALFSFSWGRCEPCCVCERFERGLEGLGCRYICTACRRLYCDEKCVMKRSEKFEWGCVCEAKIETCKNDRILNSFSRLEYFETLGPPTVLTEMLKFSGLFQPGLDVEYRKYHDLQSDTFVRHYSNLCCTPLSHPYDRNKILHVCKLKNILERERVSNIDVRRLSRRVIDFCSDDRRAREDRERYFWDRMRKNERMWYGWSE